jgi:Ca-activated chloride channel homolog
MFTRRFIIMLCVIGASFQAAAWLDPYRDAVTRGNEEFGHKKYHNAKQYYRNARDHAPGENDLKKLTFNEGDADYMLEDYEAALSGFQRASQAEEKDVQKKALFNTGNAFLKQGKYREAVEAYMSALKIDPRYEGPKKNIEYLLKKMNDRENRAGDKGKEGDKKNRDNIAQNKKQSGSSINDQNAQEKKGNTSGMNQEQIKNILRSMQQNPVQRRKGNPNERRKLEKFW